MDVVGITQHHDAVTGTAKTHVADDYNRKISHGIHYSNSAYSDIISDLAASAGVNSNNWSWCNRQNGTYTECPIASQPTSDMVIATHNPSNLVMETLQILVPHANWKVQMLDSSSKWVDTEANVVCN